MRNFVWGILTIVLLPVWLPAFAVVVLLWIICYIGKDVRDSWRYFRL